MVIPTLTQARTWWIEKDGSGDFTNIQDAMSVCASSDTIRIGPGRYDRFQQVPAGGGWLREAILGVTKDDLTFIGAGNTNTIIGPTSMYSPGTQPEPMAVVSFADVSTRFVDIGFENTPRGLIWEYGGLDIVRCRFAGNRYGVYAWPTTDVSVVDSDFSLLELGSTGIIASGPPSFLVANCQFVGANINEHGISLSSATGATIRDCHFATNLALSIRASTVSVLRCTTDPATRGAVDCSGSNVRLLDNVFYGDFASLYITGWSTVYGTGNVLSGGAEIATIYISTQSAVTLHDNHIFKTGEYAVIVGQYFYELVTNDLSGNYWGSTDPDVVGDWIWDANDDPVLRGYVEYMPLADSPVSRESRSWGAVKSMFR